LGIPVRPQPVGAFPKNPAIQIDEDPIFLSHPPSPEGIKKKDILKSSTSHQLLSQLFGRGE
jgi:hypothetical protein